MTKKELTLQEERQLVIETEKLINQAIRNLNKIDNVFFLESARQLLMKARTEIKRCK
jgi:hypothetical protein